MTFSEAVEPRFATVSVTDPQANQETDGRPAALRDRPEHARHPAEAEPPAGLVPRLLARDLGRRAPGQGRVHVRRRPEPRPGAAVRHPLADRERGHARPPDRRAGSRYLTAMCAIGLLLLRALLVRDVPRRVPGASLRSLTVAFWISIGAALIATPIYDVMSTAKFAQRSAFDLGDVVPLLTSSHFGTRAARLRDRPRAARDRGRRSPSGWTHPKRRERSVARSAGADRRADRGGRALFVPGFAGHAAQTNPRWLSIGLDWLHLLAGSFWIGGLVGLLVLGLEARRAEGAGADDRRAALLPARLRERDRAGRVRHRLGAPALPHARLALGHLVRQGARSSS